MLIVTHSGKFHADDAWAVAVLLLLYPDAELVRTRDPAIIARADVAIDVGGEWNPAAGRFDHHQKGFDGARMSGVPYASAGLVWREVALRGTASGDFETQIRDLQPFLEENWRASVSPVTGMPIYERPVVLVLYREDQQFLLDSVIPRAGRAEANFDLVIASQPYRAKSSVNFRAKRIIAPLARGLRAGGRLIGIHSHGQDPGLEIIQAVWPGENPFAVSRHELLRAVKYELGSAGRDLNFNAYADHRSIFRYDMEALPNEVTGLIGTSTAFAAWNAAVYVAQVEDDRLTEMTQSGRYLDATREVLRRHNGLWFYDESYVISRRRD